MSELDGFIDRPSKATFKDIIFNPAIIIFVLGTLILIIVVILYFKYQITEKETNVIETKETNYSITKDIYIDISGAVKIPGVYKLQEGDRVQDVLIKAGNLLDTAHMEWIQKQLNLAATLNDGQKIYIPFESESISNLQGYITKNNSSINSNLININQATEKDLEKLPRIGTVTAQKIINYRQENGDFTSVSDIKNVSGISDNIFSEIESLITVN
ncbi:competence protein ComE [Candidatus Beckwithbacteria bacterium CG23_combo_of_CG06-09_8_20_14_all_34_8]|uniref:Competence protein ComE n=1 Tax=Candidatus Beckwithbacteria bacterium CG23_combo_of_CG06-09_8_20_14_all_34_8 TaxID=1974497 RepID=A0A2H0B5D6_9BACT|nr:MAG: competence protein ComE [Candidatus Beckwithbacteria bacterium CG23_combo_of_CG06-09_8_20_14_all_34_8]